MSVVTNINVQGSEYIMKRFIKIRGEINLTIYDSNAWDLTIKITPEDIVPFFIELNLLLYKRAEAVIVESSETGEKVNLLASDILVDSKVSMMKDDYKIEFSHRDIQEILEYLLEYYRDSFTTASRMHILVKDELLGKLGAVTIEATKTAGHLEDLTEERWIGADEIEELLKGENVIFIVVEIEATWISKDETLDFWRDEVSIRLVPLEAEGFYLEDFPDEYCYAAMKCRNNKDVDDLTCYIKLKMYH